MTTEYTDHFRLNLPDFRMGPWHDLVNEDFVTIDQLLFSLYQGVDTQVWANNTHYTPGQTAIDSVDNSFWVCVTEHTSAPVGTFAADRTAHPGYWNRVVVGIAPRGEWMNSTHYLPNDMVSDSSEHVIAVCKTEHVSNASGTIRDDAAYWTFIADIGSASAIAENIAYDNSVSGTTKTNLQDTTDELYSQNASQQTAINANTAGVANHGPRITALESSDATQTANIATNSSNITNLQGRMTTAESTNTAQDTRLTNLETASATHITEAPNDGITYARKNRAWIDVLSVAGASVLVSDTPPSSPRDGQLWWESDTGRLYIYYNDGNTTQWVDAVPILDAANFVAKSGDIMTGDLSVFKNNPSINLNRNTVAAFAALFGQLNGSTRWGVILGDGSTETGSNAGSNFTVNRYADNGAYLGTALTLYRNSGLLAAKLLGVSDASSAGVGEVGEVRTAAVTGTISSSATPTNIGSITLPPGRWMVGYTAAYNSSTGATASTEFCSILSSTSSPSISAGNALSGVTLRDRYASTSDKSGVHTQTPYPVNNSVTNTYYVHGQFTFSAGTGCGLTGVIVAQRIG